MPTKSTIASVRLATLCFATLFLAVAASDAIGAKPPESAIAEKAAAKEGVPQALIIGDSISLGYTPHVVQLLKGKANVVHHKGNAGPTMRGIAEIDQWIGDKQWDIIHFNWGLWDMYGWRYEKIDRSPAAYAKRLETLVARLKKTNAKLIWATTTPICPDAEKKCKVKIDPATERKYLDAALRVMKKHSIQVNDLHAFMSSQRTKYAIADNDVHYTREGSKKLAELVAKHVVAAVKK